LVGTLGSWLPISDDLVRHNMADWQSFQTRGHVSPWPASQLIRNPQNA
jgi:hypothetical protein